MVKGEEQNCFAAKREGTLEFRAAQRLLATGAIVCRPWWRRRQRRGGKELGCIQQQQQQQHEGDSQS